MLSCPSALIPFLWLPHLRNTPPPICIFSDCPLFAYHRLLFSAVLFILPSLLCSPHRDQFISQITFGHHKQLPALRSVPFSPLPSPPLPPPRRFPSNVHSVIAGLLFPSTAHAIKPLPPLPHHPPRPVHISQFPRVWGGWKGGMRTGCGRFPRFFFLPGSLRCSGGLHTNAFKGLQSASPGTLITGLLQSPDPS